MGHRDLLVPHNLSDGDRHDCRPHPRGSVRRTNGFLLTLVLYRRRAHEKVEVSAASRRAFDKAVRRKPLADAADAGLWKLNGAEERYRGMPGRWAGATGGVAGR